MGTHLRELSENFLMSTNITGFDVYQKSLHPCALDESSLSIGRVSPFASEVHACIYLQALADYFQVSTIFASFSIDRISHSHKQ